MRVRGKMTKIVRSWNIGKNFLCGIDNKGNTYVKCIKCSQTMSLYDYKIVHGRKVQTYVCKVCKVKKILR